MNRLTVPALRGVLALSAAGALALQALLVAVLVRGDAGDDAVSEAAATVVIVLVVLGLAALQVVAVCIWRLLTMARLGTVFTPAASRYVDVVIGAVFGTSLLVFGIAVALAPGEAIAPGVVGIICGISLVVAGIGLIVLVMRTLLAQAVALDAQANELQAELDTVI